MARTKKSTPKFKNIKGKGRCKSVRKKRSDGVMTTVWKKVKPASKRKRKRKR